MKTLKLLVVALTILMSCKKTNVDANPEPIIYGDSVAFSPKVYPYTVTQDINDRYLFGDSVYIHKNCFLIKIALSTNNSGGYTTKCKLIVNKVEIETRGVPTYNAPNDSTFKFNDTVALHKGWNFIQFTGFSWAPSTIYYRIDSGAVTVVDSNYIPLKIVGLPLSRKRTY